MKLFTKISREKGLSQSELARISNINRTVLSDVENGRRLPYPKMREKVAEALGWMGDPEQLFEEVPDGR